MLIFLLALFVQIPPDLAALKPLVKPHYTWSFPDDRLDDVNDANVLQVVRIIGSIGWHMDFGTADQLRIALAIAGKVHMAHGRDVSLSIVHRPYHNNYPCQSTNGKTDCDPRLDPTPEILWLIQRLKVLQDGLAASTYKPQVAYLLDSEVFGHRGDEEWDRGIRQKLSLTTSLLSLLAPTASRHWYGFGVQESASTTGWSPYPWASLQLAQEIRSFSCALYSPWDPWSQRLTAERTLALAREVGVRKIDVWIALGGGYVRDWERFRRWESDVLYDAFYDRYLGAVLNHPWYTTRPERYGPGADAETVIFYPGPFDSRTPRWLECFANYVSGATE